MGAPCFWSAFSLNTIIPDSEGHLFASTGSQFGPTVRWIRGKWSEDHLLIEGDDELLTVVSFVILDDGTTPNFIGDYPHALLAALPLRHGKSLFVIAGREPPRNYRAVVEQALAKIGPEIANTLAAPHENDEPTVVCLTGDNPEGYAYMVTVPVEVPLTPA